MGLTMVSSKLKVDDRIVRLILLFLIQRSCQRQQMQWQRTSCEGNSSEYFDLSPSNKRNPLAFLVFRLFLLFFARIKLNDWPKKKQFNCSISSTCGQTKYKQPYNNNEKNSKKFSLQTNSAIEIRLFVLFSVRYFWKFSFFSLSIAFILHSCKQNDFSKRNQGRR